MSSHYVQPQPRRRAAIFLTASLCDVKTGSTEEVAGTVAKERSKKGERLAFDTATMAATPPKAVMPKWRRVLYALLSATRSAVRFVMRRLGSWRVLTQGLAI